LGALPRLDVVATNRGVEGSGLEAVMEWRGTGMELGRERSNRAPRRDEKGQRRGATHGWGS